MTGNFLTLSRLINAPRELVFSLWITPQHLAQWFAPRGFTIPFCEVDARVGGELRLDMQGPDGTVYPLHSTFEELDPPALIVTRNNAKIGKGDDAAGLEVVNTITFTSEGGKTRVTVHAEVIRVSIEMQPSVAGMEQGWNETLDKLAEVVAGLV